MRFRRSPRALGPELDDVRSLFAEKMVCIYVVSRSRLPSNFGSHRT